MRNLFPLVTGAVLATSSLAQNLIGLGVDPAGNLPPAILRQALCQPGARVCAALAPVIIPGPPAWAGGLAYNPRKRTVWYSTGPFLIEQGIEDCALVCRAPAAPVLGPLSTVSGLDLAVATGVLFQIETVPGVLALHQWNIAACPPLPGPVCQLLLPTPQHLAGGVAIDQQNGMIFYAASVFAGGPPANVLLGAMLGNPCNIVCRLPLPACGPLPLGPITALAYDECRQSLYVSDGAQTLTLRRTALGPCDFQPVLCCPTSPAVGPYGWVGFDVEADHPQQVGASCFGAGCVACPNMELRALGDAVIGNPMFALQLDQGPVGNLMALAVAPGGCAVPGLPVLCGQWHPDLGTSIFLPFAPIVGGAPCQGQATVPLPIPADYSLCGGALCFQGVIVCLTSAPPGLGLTNAVGVVLN